MLALTKDKNNKSKELWPFRLTLTPLLALTLAASMVSCGKRETKASEGAESATGGQRTFASPADAGTAIFEAAKGGDQVALMAIFGPEGKDVLFFMLVPTTFLFLSR